MSKEMLRISEFLDIETVLDDRTRRTVGERLNVLLRDDVSVASEQAPEKLVERPRLALDGNERDEAPFRAKYARRLGDEMPRLGHVLEHVEDEDRVHRSAREGHVAIHPVKFEHVRL